jgi:hypothetical protein
MKTIEEHARNMNLPRSVLAAVMEAQAWAYGKEVSEEAFFDAVESFLNRPMGGIDVTRG